jgi:hypothetical protein
MLVQIHLIVPHISLRFRSIAEYEILHAALTVAVAE